MSFYQVGFTKFNHTHDQQGRFGTALAADVPLSRNYGDAAKNAGAKVHAEALAEEPAITSQMKGIAKDTGGKLVGLPFRVKSTDSLTRKIALDAQGKGISADEAASQISDSVRYTIMSDEKSYTSTAKSAIATLKHEGYSVRVKNFWAKGDPYQGINTAVVSPTGQKFELQFHTQKSFDLKEHDLHPLYEKFRTSTNLSERTTLWGKMSDMANALPIPSGVESIPDLKTQSLVG